MRKPVAFAFLVLLLCVVVARAQDPSEEPDAQPDTARLDAAIRQLSAPNATIRRSGAEELAQLADTSQVHLVEGYRVQEKHGQVRLALDWALYRMGSTDRLYLVVNELNGRSNSQAVGYLGQIDDPAVLYPFLNTVTGKTLVGILNALGKAGNAGTIDRIRIFQSNFDRQVATAAKDAEAEILQRAAQAPATPGSRERVAPPPQEANP